MKKTSSIVLGRSADGAEVRVDVGRLISTRMFISASSGGGKSETIRHILEQLFGAVQCIVIDREGEYPTLREKFGFVLVGEGGETPAHPHTARQVALTLLKTGASAVIDVSEMKHGDMHEFVAKFCAGLMEAPKELWHPCIIVVDEAQVFAPEKGYGESPALGPITELCNRGRKRGFCPILATQRAAKVSKNCTEPLQNFLIGLTMPDDQQRVSGMFKIPPGKPTREFSLELENLEPGEFFARGAAIGKQPVKVQIQRAITKPPKAGSAAAAKHPPTPDSIRHLLPTLAEIPKEAERKEVTEKEMRKRIADLEREVRDAKKTVVVAAAPAGKPIKTDRERMLEAQVASLYKTAGAYEKVLKSIGAQADKVIEMMASVKAQVESLKDEGAAATDAVVAARDLPAAEPKRNVPALVRPVSTPTATPAEPHEGISQPEQRILDAVAWFDAIGVAYPEQTAVAFMAGYSLNSSSFKNPRGSLGRKGLIVVADGRISLTEAGGRSANAPAIELTNSALQKAVLAKLPQPEQKLLGPLIAAYPDGMTSEDLASASGYSLTSSSFKNPRGKLGSFGLTEIRDGKIYARNVLFPEGE